MVMNTLADISHPNTRPHQCETHRFIHSVHQYVRLPRQTLASHGWLVLFPHRTFNSLTFLTESLGLIFAAVSLVGASKWPGRDFPGGPVVKTASFQCRGPGFDPWLEN